jgi:hypothetical protein
MTTKFRCLVLVAAALLATRLTPAAQVPPDSYRPTLVPLKSLTSASGDLAVRIHYMGSLVTVETWLTLIRHGDESTADYWVESILADVHSRHEEPIPTVPWRDVWDQLTRDGLFELANSQPGIRYCGNTVPIDAETVEVELVRLGTFRRYSYYAPTEQACPDTRKLMTVLKYLQKVVRGPLPFDSQ